MGETANTEEKVTKSTEKKQESKIKVWFRGIKTEFKKILWPDKRTLLKESTAVVIVSVVLGAIIALLDLGIKYGLSLL